MVSAVPITKAQSVAAIAPPADRQGKPAFYLPELDGLRTCAFLYMFLFHSWKIPHPPKFFIFDWYNQFILWGFVGLDLFFVLSGYLITYLLLKEKIVRGDISFPHYFKRRTLRIWPLYYLAIIFGAFVVPAIAHRHLSCGTYVQFLTQIVVPMFLWLGNYALVAGSSVLNAITAQVQFPLSNLFNPLWSVCVEEQFYLTWPFILKKARSARQLLLAVALLVGASMISRFCFHQIGLSDPAISKPYYYCTISRFDPLLAGALVAIIQLYLPNVWKWVCKYPTAIALGGTLILGSIVSFVPAGVEQVNVVWIYSSIALSFAMILAGTVAGAPLKKILSQPWLAQPGRVTYGMYIVHHPIMVLCEQYLRKHTTLEYGPIFYLIRTSVSLLLTYAVAMLLWTTFESKFNAMRKRCARV